MIFNLVLFSTSYFLFPWKKAVPEQKKPQKADVFIMQWTTKNMQILWEKKKKKEKKPHSSLNTN